MIDCTLPRPESHSGSASDCSVTEKLKLVNYPEHTYKCSSPQQLDSGPPQHASGPPQHASKNSKPALSLPIFRSRYSGKPGRVVQLITEAASQTTEEHSEAPMVTCDVGLLDSSTAKLRPEIDRGCPPLTGPFATISRMLITGESYE